MRIFKVKKQNNILFQFTERKFDNKINSFKKFAKTYTRSFFKRKDKPSGVYVNYTWGYKTKEPGIYFTRHVFPLGVPMNLNEVLKWVISDMEEKHNIFIDHSDEEEKQIYYLREIEINFVYT